MLCEGIYGVFSGQAGSVSSISARAKCPFHFGLSRTKKTAELLIVDTPPLFDIIKSKRKEYLIARRGRMRLSKKLRRRVHSQCPRDCYRDCSSTIVPTQSVPQCCRYSPPLVAATIHHCCIGQYA